MEVVLILLLVGVPLAVFGIILWPAVFGSKASGALPSATNTSAPTPTATTSTPRRVTEVTRLFDPAEDVAYPPNLPTVSGKIRGISYATSSVDIFKGTCRLIPEPDNSYDKNAVLVFFDDRKGGYIPAGRAQSYAPLLTQLGAPLVVTYRRHSDTAYPRIDLPSVPALRAFVRDHANQ